MSDHRIVEENGILKLKLGHQVLATGKQKAPGQYLFTLADGTERTIRVRESWRDIELIEELTLTPEQLKAHRAALYAEPKRCPDCQRYSCNCQQIRNDEARTLHGNGGYG